MIDSARAEAERWLAAEPDADIRAELEALLAGPADELARRFDGRLQFGTAGLRAAVGAGPQRMNRLVVRQAAAGLADVPARHRPACARAGRDHRLRRPPQERLFALDTACVMAAYGIRAMLFDQFVPTPVLAWSITEVDAAAGVVVTASHNPPADNGYKVYLDDGAQIVPPHDAGIAARIDEVDPVAVDLAPRDHPLIESVGSELIDAYIAAAPGVRLRPEVPGVTVAYTRDARRRRCGPRARRSRRPGLPAPMVVPEQFEPDGTFPTVSFPNPEEPGAMDLLLAVAAESGALAAIANDPDADRLGAAIPQPDGSWRRLGGDELGWLLAEHILDHTSGDDRFVVTTLVSSSLLGRMAAEYGVHYAETFTGFKWIGRTVLDQPERALRVRVRAGARLPRDAPATRQGRHHRGDHVRRGGGARRPPTV